MQDISTQSMSCENVECVVLSSEHRRSSPGRIWKLARKASWVSSLLAPLTNRKAVSTRSEELIPRPIMKSESYQAEDAVYRQ